MSVRIAALGSRLLGSAARIRIVVPPEGGEEPINLTFSFSPASATIPDNTQSGSTIATGSTNGAGDGTLEITSDPLGKIDVDGLDIVLGDNVEGEVGVYAVGWRYHSDSAAPGQEVTGSFSLVLTDADGADDDTYGFYQPVPDEEVEVVSNGDKGVIVTSSTLPGIAVDTEYSTGTAAVQALDAQGGGWLVLPAGEMVFHAEHTGASSIGIRGQPNEHNRPATHITVQEMWTGYITLKTDNHSTRLHLKHLKIGAPDSYILENGPQSYFGDRGIRLWRSGQVLVEDCTVWHINKDGLESTSNNPRNKRLYGSFICRRVELSANGIGPNLHHNAYMHDLGEFRFEDSVSYGGSDHQLKLDGERAIIKNSTIKKAHGNLAVSHNNTHLIDVTNTQDFVCEDTLIWINNDVNNGPGGGVMVTNRGDAPLVGLKFYGGVWGWIGDDTDARNPTWHDGGFKDATHYGAGADGAHSAGATTLKVRLVGEPIREFSGGTTLSTDMGVANAYYIIIAMSDGTTHQTLASLTDAGVGSSTNATFTLANALPSSLANNAMIAIRHASSSSFDAPIFNARLYHRNHSDYLWTKIVDGSGNLDKDNAQIYRQVVDRCLFISDKDFNTSTTALRHYAFRPNLHYITSSIAYNIPLPPLKPPRAGDWADDVPGAGEYVPLQGGYTNMATLPTGFDGDEGSDYIHPMISMLGDVGIATVPGKTEFSSLIEPANPLTNTPEGLRRRPAWVRGNMGHVLQADGQLVFGDDAVIAPRVQIEVANTVSSGFDVELVSTSGLSVGQKIQLQYIGYWTSERLSPKIVSDGAGGWKFEPNDPLPSLLTATIAAIDGNTVTLSQAIPGEIQGGSIGCAFQPAASRPDWWPTADDFSMPNQEY